MLGAVQKLCNTLGRGSLKVQKVLRRYKKYYDEGTKKYYEAGGGRGGSEIGEINIT